MSSTLGGILSTARSALLAQQAASNTTAHNIANANTEGYSRQNVSLAASPPLRTPYGALGTGVSIVDIARERDVLLDSAYRREASAAADFRMRHELLGRIESNFGEIGGEGLGAAFDAFWSSWSDLANNPSNPAARSAVRETGRRVATEFNRLAGGLDEIARYARDRVEADVTRLNELTESIADLNRKIVAFESNGTTASDLRDARDIALDELSRIVPVQVVDRANGSVGVTVGGVGIVDGSSTQPLELESLGGGQWRLRTSAGTTVPTEGGSVGAALDVLTRELPRQLQALDEIAETIVNTVNDLHRQGISPAHGDDPALGPIDFFDPAGTDARSIRLSDAVRNDVRAIAAAFDDGTGEYRAGANDLALGLAQLRDDTDTVGNRSFGDAYADLVADVGFQVASARSSTSVHETLVAQSEARRASVSGVSIDEELTRLIQQQAAYRAAARVVTAVDEMLQSLVTMV